MTTDAQFTAAQNDIVDFFEGLLKFLREFFDWLDSRKTQALGTCEQAFFDAMKAEMLVVAARVPDHVKAYIACKFASPSTQALDIGQLWQLIQLVMKYLPQILELLRQLGILPGGPTNPPAPAPSGSYSPREVARCA